jgi:hypothetical protein
MGTRDYIARPLLGAVSVGIGYSQTDARISVSQGTINAGDSLVVNLTGLDLPSPCDTNIVINFGSSAPVTGFTVSGPLKKGETSSTLTANLPFDFQSGVFTSQGAYMEPCPGYTRAKSFTVPAVTVNIKPVPDPNQYPTSAKIVLSFTQKQFLNSKSSELGDLNSELYTYATQNPANTPPA